MAKIVKNTTGSAITLKSAGVTLPASSSRTLEVQEYLLWGSAAVITEITPYLGAGSIVINDGYYDLDSTNALRHLQHPDTAFNVRFLSDPERVNGFLAKNVQEAIEEAAAGSVVGIPPTTTVGAVTAVAYSLALADNTTYLFDARTVARRTDVVGDTGHFQNVIRVKRQGGGGATIVGYEFQVQAQRDDSAMDVYWDVLGNSVQLKVVGVAAKTINWQPQIETDDVS